MVTAGIGGDCSCASEKSEKGDRFIFPTLISDIAGSKRVGRCMPTSRIISLPDDSGRDVDLPRMGRVLLPNYLHHIVQHGHYRQVVFAEDAQSYLADLRELKDVFGVKVWSGGSRAGLN